MIPALSLKELEERIHCAHQEGEACVAALVLARYDIEATRKIIKEHYRYWDTTSGKQLDCFWAGYGVYPTPEVNPSQVIPFTDGSPSIFYDPEAFISIRNELVQKGIKVKDNRCYLLVFDIINRMPRFDNSFVIDLGNNELRILERILESMDSIINLSASITNTRSIATVMRIKRAKKFVAENFLELLTTGSTLFGSSTWR